ncbi:MAG: Exodeoxyribonuclease 7 large subunit [Candidatus Saccharibacteria bacterium]|nr:Exodeoxyribonuclease 7 large subunit [Candidatus Saccharibacteria bacterium]
MPLDAGEPEVSVSDFVALLNQALDYAFPSVTIVGELANFRVSKNRWVYFDLKDEFCSVKFFGTVYQLPGPLEDGMLLRVRGQPKLHNLYGFSVNVLSMAPAGEGSIRKAADLLQAKLTTEGLFDEGRKRPVPYPPKRIGLVTSRQSAAYADFTKIINARWGGVQIDVIDVQVQGEPAPAQIVGAIEQFNALGEPPEVIVIIRGGGSAEDLAAFSTEQVTRAVAASRVPTIVAIGHEVDLSLAELAADVRASTPSNAAELLVPDRKALKAHLARQADELLRLGAVQMQAARQLLSLKTDSLHQYIEDLIKTKRSVYQTYQKLLAVLSPEATLKRGYAIVRSNGGQVLRSAKIKPGAIVEVQLADGRFTAQTKEKP